VHPQKKVPGCARRGNNRETSSHRGFWGGRKRGNCETRDRVILGEGHGAPVGESKIKFRGKDAGAPTSQSTRPEGLKAAE